MAKVYERINWEDLPSKNTPINAENLNRMEEGIYDAHVELAKKMEIENPTGTGAFSMNRKEGTTVGDYSTAEGYNCTASGKSAHAEGASTTASGSNSHAEGFQGTASGEYSHIEGFVTSSSGEGAHAEGGKSSAQGQYAHAEGNRTAANAYWTHSEGTSTEANALGSHAEGGGTIANGYYSHSEGSLTIANGYYSHSEGCKTRANGDSSHAGGFYTTTNNHSSMVTGKYNKNIESVDNVYTASGDAFVIGNGYCTDTTTKNIEQYVQSNAFRVTYLGDTYGLSAFNSSGADYSEFIKPWGDGNEDNEDRVGYFVTIKDGTLYKAEEGDYIAGIISGNPSVVGNGDEDYYWKYKRDEFNRIVMEDIPEIIIEEDEEGNTSTKETGAVIEKARMKLAEDYDPTLQYIPRKNRKEWDYVGMVGVLPVRDDGTCEAGQFCKCGGAGIATLATERGFDTYMVIERLAENVVSVILK